MKILLLQMSAILALVGLFAHRTIAAERSGDDLYSESIYVEKPVAETPSSISDVSKAPMKGRSRIAKINSEEMKNSQ